MGASSPLAAISDGATFAVLTVASCLFARFAPDAINRRRRGDVSLATLIAAA